jgi:hypothetical protein
MNADEKIENKETALKTQFPALGWSDRFDVPAEMIGATILFIGSQEERAELVIDYLTASGDRMRVILGFTERGMWIVRNEALKASNQDADE